MIILNILQQPGLLLHQDNCVLLKSVIHRISNTQSNNIWINCTVFIVSEGWKICLRGQKIRDFPSPTYSKTLYSSLL